MNGETGDVMEFDLETVLLAAMKSEAEANSVYNKLANKLSNPFVKDKLRLLAKEENGHRLILETLYSKLFPEEEIKLPDGTPVPVPQLDHVSDNVKPQRIFYYAMKAELEAMMFYRQMAKALDKNEELKKMFEYLADMEMSHYFMLKIEKKYAAEMQDYIKNAVTSKKIMVKKPVDPKSLGKIKIRKIKRPKGTKEGEKAGKKGVKKRNRKGREEIREEGRTRRDRIWT